MFLYISTLRYQVYKDTRIFFYSFEIINIIDNYIYWNMVECGMVTSQNVGIGASKTHKAPKEQNKRPQKGWNLSCDPETHEALDILGAWMMGKEKMPDELKDSITVPKTKVIKILAFEKLKSLKLLKQKGEGVN